MTVTIDGAPMPRTDIALQVEDSAAMSQAPACHSATGTASDGPKSVAWQVRMAVAVVPGPLVAVVTARRDQAIQHFGQVALQTRLELDRADRRRAAHTGHLDDARL